MNLENQPLPLTDDDLAELAAKVKNKMKEQFGSLRINTWLMANDPQILQGFVKHTFDQVRIKILEMENKNG